ncbi:hypothetical protein [Clostridium butyricum]
MKKKILGILLGALLLSNISIPTFAYVDNGQLNIYKNKLDMVRNEFNSASSSSNTGELNNSTIKTKAFLDELNNYIKANTIDEFQKQCNETITVMEKYNQYQHSKLKEQEKQSGFGTMYGREHNRVSSTMYLDTCALLLDDLKNYNTSFDWYVKEANSNNKIKWEIEEDGQWRCYKDGEMLKNTFIDGYFLGADGSLIM